MFKRSLESSLSEGKSVNRDKINIDFVKIKIHQLSLGLLTSSENRFLVSIVSVPTRALGFMLSWAERYNL